MKYIVLIALAFLLMGTSCEDGSSIGPGSEYNIVEGIFVTDECGGVVREVGTPHVIENQEVEYGGSDETFTVVYPNMKLCPNPNNGRPVVVFTSPEDMHCKVWIENAYPSNSLNSELNNFFNVPDSKEKNVIDILIDEEVTAGFKNLVWLSEGEVVQQGFYRIFLKLGDDTFYTDVLMLYEDIPGFNWYSEN